MVSSATDGKAENAGMHAEKPAKYVYYHSDSDDDGALRHNVATAAASAVTKVHDDADTTLVLDTSASIVTSNTLRSSPLEMAPLFVLPQSIAAKQLSIAHLMSEGHGTSSDATAIVFESELSEMNHAAVAVASTPAQASINGHDDKDNCMLTMQSVLAELRETAFRCAYGLIPHDVFVGVFLTQLETHMQSLQDCSIELFVQELASLVLPVHILETAYSQKEFVQVIETFETTGKSPSLWEMSQDELVALQQWLEGIRKHKGKPIDSSNLDDVQLTLAQSIRRLRISVAQLQVVIICEILRICKDVQCSVPIPSFETQSVVKTPIVEGKSIAMDSTPTTSNEVEGTTSQQRSKSKGDGSSRRKSKGLDFIDEMLADHLAIESPSISNRRQSLKSIKTPGRTPGSVSRTIGSSMINESGGRRQGQNNTPETAYLRLLDTLADKLSIWTTVEYPLEHYVSTFIDPVLTNFYKIPLPMPVRQFKKRAGADVTPRKNSKSKLIATIAPIQTVEDEADANKENIPPHLAPTSTGSPPLPPCNRPSPGAPNVGLIDQGCSSNSRKREATDMDLDNPFVVSEGSSSLTEDTIKRRKRVLLTSSLNDVTTHRPSAGGGLSSDGSIQSTPPWDRSNGLSFISRLSRNSTHNSATTTQTSNNAGLNNAPVNATPTTSRSVPLALQRIAGRQVNVSGGRRKSSFTRSSSGGISSTGNGNNDRTKSGSSKIPVPTTKNSKDDVKNGSLAVMKAFGHVMSRKGSSMESSTTAASCRMERSGSKKSVDSPSESQQQTSQNEFVSPIKRRNSSKNLLSPVENSIKPRVRPKRISSPGSNTNSIAPKFNRVMFGCTDTSPLKAFNSGVSLLQSCNTSTSPLSKAMSRSLMGTTKMQKQPSSDKQSYLTKGEASGNRLPLGNLDNIVYDMSTYGNSVGRSHIGQNNQYGDDVDSRSFASSHGMQDFVDLGYPNGDIDESLSSMVINGTAPCITPTKSSTMKDRRQSIDTSSLSSKNIEKTPERSINNVKAATPGSCHRLQKVLEGFDDIDWDSLA